MYFSRGKFLEQGVMRDLALHPGNLIQIRSFIYYLPDKSQILSPFTQLKTKHLYHKYLRFNIPQIKFILCSLNSS